MLMFKYLIYLSHSGKSPTSPAEATSPRSAEVPGNVGRTSSWQPPSSMTETATLSQTEQGNQRTKEMKGQIRKDVDGKVVWIQQEVSEREGIV